MNKTIKLALFLCLIVLVGVLTLTACQGRDNPTDNTQGATTDRTTPEETTPATGSVGLAYTVNNDGTTCTITGIGTCTDAEIHISKMIDGYKVTAIDHLAFSRCSNLTSITIPDSVTTIGTEAFFGCSNLTSVTIPNSVTQIYYGAFSGCSNLTSVTIPDSVSNLGAGVFQSCEKLTSVTIGNSVPAIGMYSFDRCSNLTSITIPDSVTAIDLWTFRYCSNLTSIIFGGTITQWNTISKGLDWNAYTGEYTVHCTNGTIAKDGTIVYN